MKIYRDLYSFLLLILSVILIFYVFFKSEIYWNGDKREYYKIYYYLSTLFLLFSLSFFFIKKKIKIYLIICFLSSIIALYSFEYFLINKDQLILSKKEKIYFKETSKKFEKRNRIEIYNYYKNINKNMKIVASPHYYLYKKNIDIFPLSGFSYAKTINCKENGYYSIFESDRYGFNNPDDQWDKDHLEYLLVGDSFAKGSCVNRPNDIASQLRKLSNKTSITVGYNSKGPLMEFATLKEYIKPNVKNVVWLFFEGNDVYNLENELNNKFLQQYLVNIDFRQNLVLKQKQIDNLSELLISEVLKKKEKELQVTDSLSFKVIKFLKFYNLRKLLLNYESNSTYEYLLNKKTTNALTKIFQSAKTVSATNNSKFYMVYLPSYERFTKKRNNLNYDIIKSIAKTNDINFIDINKELFSKIQDPLIYFPFRSNGHYNEKGYFEIAKILYRIIK